MKGTSERVRERDWRVKKSAGGGGGRRERESERDGLSVVWDKGRDVQYVVERATITTLKREVEAWQGEGEKEGGGWVGRLGDEGWEWRGKQGKIMEKQRGEDKGNERLPITLNYFLVIPSRLPQICIPEFYLSNFTLTLLSLL